MLTTTATVPIARPGDEWHLTPDQVWAGLLIRARNQDVRFVPPGHQFDVISDEDGKVTRRVRRHDGRDELQHIHFFGCRLMVIDFAAGPQRSHILTSIENDEQSLWYLTCTYLTDCFDLKPGSIDEAETIGRARPLMIGQLSRVIDTVRDLVTEGTIA